MKELILADKDRGKKPNTIQLFFRETSGELRKVSWPTWPEARQLTLLVLAVMVVMGAILGLTDAGARALLNLILGFS
jgi:preprotein translocase subunit SecE